MSRYFSIEKVPFTSALLGLAATAHLGFVTYRPNRIAAGKLVFLWQIHGDLWIVILTLWVTMFILSVLNFRQRRPLLFTILSSVQLLLLIAAAGKHAAFTAREAGSIARVSLGAAFWTSLFLLIIIQLDTLQKTRKMKNIMILIVILSCAMSLWMLFSGWLDSLSILREFSNRRERF